MPVIGAQTSITLNELLEIGRRSLLLPRMSWTAFASCPWQAPATGTRRTASTGDLEPPVHLLQYPLLIYVADGQIVHREEPAHRLMARFFSPLFPRPVPRRRPPPMLFLPATCAGRSFYARERITMRR